MSKFALLVSVYICFIMIDLVLFYLMIMRALDLAKESNMKFKDKTEDKYYICKLMFVIATPIFHIISCAMLSRMVFCSKDKFKELF